MQARRAPRTIDPSTLLVAMLTTPRSPAPRVVPWDELAGKLAVMDGVRFVTRTRN